MKAGYFYIAYGEKGKIFIKEAIVSAKSLKAQDSGAHITLLTDREVPWENPFDGIMIKEDLIPKHTFMKTGKLDGRCDGWGEGKMWMDLSPYDRTLFVDTDTYFYDKVSGIFEILDWYDMAMVPVVSDGPPKHPDAERQIEGLIPWNTGIILYLKNELTNQVFKRWREIYREQREHQRRRNDQPYFQLAVNECPSLKVHPLPRIYNARVHGPINLFGKVKIAHGRTGGYGKVDFKEIEGQINKDVGCRAWIPSERRTRK